MNEAATDLIAWLQYRQDSYPISVVTHRLVQGGPLHRQPELITPQLMKGLQQYIYLAPNHLPDEIMLIRNFESAYPEAVQIACFDTGFHDNLPSHARNYPLPAKYKEKGLFKYGFHGLSFDYILTELTTKHSGTSLQKIIIAHLGNGASMAAVDRGICVDTTMGVSPIGGLVMSTRSGDLDPGVLLFLMNHCQLGASELDDLLSKHSGLKAIAGISDFEELLKRAPEQRNAKAALKAFSYSAKKHIGSLAAALEGLDVLAFTGGVGENASEVREQICHGLGVLGIELDTELNAGNEDIISKATSRVTVRVVRTNEELMMARLSTALLDKLNIQ